MEEIRQIIFYKNYFYEFFNEQTEKVKTKIDEVLFIVSIVERIPIKFFKKIEGVKDLYEIRIEYESNIYRIFCCFDKGKVVVLFNGFQKKTQKTPTKEIDKAIKIMNEYFNEIKTIFSEHLEKQYGKIGTEKRTEFEIKAKAFAIGEIIREERHLAKLTQEQLAEKTGTKKSFISRIENGHSDIQLSTLYRLLENGLGRKISLTIS